MNLKIEKTIYRDLKKISNPKVNAEVDRTVLAVKAAITPLVKILVKSFASRCMKRRVNSRILRIAVFEKRPCVHPQGL